MLFRSSICSVARKSWSAAKVTTMGKVGGTVAVAPPPTASAKAVTASVVTGTGEVGGKARPTKDASIGMPASLWGRGCILVAMSVRGGVLALAVALGLTACTGASGREPPPDRAVAAQGCGPVRYDDVRGPAPSYLRAPLAETANDHALCRGWWLPATGPAFVPQGLVVRGHRAWVSGYDHRRPQAGADACRVVVVDQIGRAHV